MILLTLGSYPLPFDRLVCAVDRGIQKGLIKDEVVAQIGCSRYEPQSMKHYGMIDKREFEELFRTADGIISHAGMGNIAMALEAGKPILVFPRLVKYSEHVNEHQLETAREFEKLGHVLAAYTEEDLYAKIPLLKTFVPKKRIATPDRVAHRVGDFLRSLVPAEVQGNHHRRS